jgi:hypothetical protein
MALGKLVKGEDVGPAGVLMAVPGDPEVSLDQRGRFCFRLGWADRE